jgi:transcriptional regulator with XRE-family HTH domain
MEDIIGEAKIRAILSKNLKRLRAKKNLSQLSLAIRAGLTHNFINDIENGKKWVSPKTLAALMAVLDTEPHEFFMPEASLPGRGSTALAELFDAITGDFQRSVEDIKDRYLQNGGKDGG